MIVGRLTARLIKYFIGTITAVVILCFIFSGLFLSIIYTGIQYREMKTASEKLYQAVEAGEGYADILEEYQISNGFIVKEGAAAMLSASRMGMMRNIDLSSLVEKGRYKSPMGEELLYYKNSKGSVDIIIFESNRFSSAYMKYTYLILGIIFFAALVISIPIVTFLGKRITHPVIMLQKASRDITNGDFDIKLDINTEDEIQDLSDSIKTMAASLEKKDVMQRDFIANVTHDFKTPLSIIRNYSEAIYDEVAGKKEEKEYLKVIMNEVDRLNYLVTDILKLSKLQSGKLEPHMESIILSELLMSFENVFKIQLNQKKIDFKVIQPGDGTETENLTITGDSKYLQRVIYNFIDNAVKFSSTGGTIRLGALEVKEGLKIYVKDNGSGIDPGYIEEIWKMYFKNESSGGMGLGLAICSEILRLHKFKYGVNSRPAEGAEFYFIIPSGSYNKS